MDKSYYELQRILKDDRYKSVSNNIEARNEEARKEIKRIEREKRKCGDCGRMNKL